MTRSVTIVNTSNWDGEDWVVKERFRGSGNSDPGPWNETIIKPGENTHSMLGSSNWEVKIEATESKEPKPFDLSGRGQVFPQVVSWVGESPKVRGG